MSVPSMKSKAERLMERVTQEKVPTIRNSMLQDEDNKHCVDASTITPAVASAKTDLLGLALGTTAPSLPPAQPPPPSTTSSADILCVKFESTSPAPCAASEPLSKAEVPTPSNGRPKFGPKSDIGPAPPQPIMLRQFQSPGLVQPMGQFQSPSQGLGQPS